MSNDTNTTLKDPRARAAAKADINKELQVKVRELRAEESNLDARIRELEIQAVRETDEERVVELIAAKNKLAARKEALPVLLRGFQVRALHAQSAALAEEAAEIKPELEAAEVALETATKLVPELKRQLEEAEKAVIEKTQQRDGLLREWQSLHNSSGLARADAGCIERGEPMKFQPNRFDGIID